MDRREFIQLGAAGSFVASAGSLSAADGAEKKENLHPSAVGKPATMAPRADGMEIVWRVSKLAKGYVEFGESEKLGSLARGDDWGLRPGGDEVIRVKIRGLKPGTKYYYRIVTESYDHRKPSSEVGEIRTFRTLDPASTSCRFTVWNDTHKQKATIKQLDKLTKGSDFLLWNGDISNDWYREGEVASSVITPADVDFTEKHPLVFLRGNHDLRGTLAWQVEDYVATPDGLPWCAFRCGPVAVICLDTGEDKPDDHKHLFGRVACEPMRKAEADWLAETIKRPDIANAPYRIVFCHIPLRWTDEKTYRGYDWFSKRSRDLWHPHLVAWKAQTIISGHTHRDAWIPANKQFPYGQLVGGGPKMHQARLITADANEKRMQIQMMNMEGKTTRQIELPPLT